MSRWYGKPDHDGSLTQRQLTEAYERALARVEAKLPGDEKRAAVILKMYRTRIEQTAASNSITRTDGVVNPPARLSAESPGATA